MRNNQYEQDYETVSYVGADGKVQKKIRYKGVYYLLHLDEAKKRRSAAGNLIAVLMALGILIAGGMVNPDSSRTAWIVLPYLCIFLPIGFWLVGALFFCMAPVKMEKVVYEGSLLRIMHSCRGILILTGGNLILDLVYLALYHGTIHIGRELCYLTSLAVLFVWVAGYGRWYDRVYGDVVVESV